MAAIFPAWSYRYQPWSYRPPRQVQRLSAGSPLGLVFSVLLSGPVAPRPAGLGLDMTVVLTLA